MDASRSIGRRIAKARAARGLSLRALARRADVSHQHLAAIEAGRSEPTVSRLVAVAAALGVPASELIR